MFPFILVFPPSKLPPLIVKGALPFLELDLIPKSFKLFNNSEIGLSCILLLPVIFVFPFASAENPVTNLKSVPESPTFISFFGDFNFPFVPLIVISFPFLLILI